MMSNLALPADPDRKSSLQTLLGLGHQWQITAVDVIFGAYMLIIIALAELAWLTGIGSPRSVAVFLVFMIINGAISEVSRRSARPVRVEIGRAIVGAIIAPAAYILADAPFGHWWPGFMIMCLGGNIILGLLTGLPWIGRLLVLYYVALLTLAEWLGTPSMNWYAFALNAGAVAMVGLLFAEIVSLLSRALANEREQRRQLALEKARSETLLQKEAEERLRESEALYRSLIENTSDGIAIIDADSTFSYINPAYQRIWGWAAEELIGQQFLQLIHPDDLALSTSNLGQLLIEPDVVVGGEIRVRHKDGSWRIVDGTAKRLPSGSIISNTRDVTEQREIEQAVRAVAEGTAAITGGDFFRSLVKHMATALRVRYAYVTQLIDLTPPSLCMLACWVGDDYDTNEQYVLEGTPCERVIMRGELGFYPRDVAVLFPHDQGLAGVQGYLGIPLKDSSGRVMGNLVIMDDKPMRDDLPANPSLRIFAGRAAAELERLRAEEKVRASEEYFRALIENATDGVVVLDRVGAYSYVSPAFARMLGYQPDVLLGRLFQAQVHPDDLDRTSRKMDTAFANPGLVVSNELRVRHNDGSWRVLEALGKVGPNGNLVANARDVTERHQIEDALRIAELRFRAVFDQPLLSVQICNPDGTMSQWNQATAGFYNVAPEVLAGYYQNYNILDDQQALTNNVQPLLRGAFAGHAAPIPPVPYDFPDGRRVWAQGFIYPVKDHTGAVREVMIMVQDITTQKEAEATLRRLNEELEERVIQRTGELNATLAQSKRLAAIIESTSDLVARTDLTGTIVYMNGAGRRLSGLRDEDDIRQFSIADFYPPDVLPVIQQRMSANIAQGIDSDRFETFIRVRDGLEIPVSLVGIVHRDADGAPESLSSVVRDISEQKRIEHELKQAKEAAEEANRAKSTFLANMSHEIRTPMNGIIGMTDLLLDTELGAAQRDFVETIRTSGDALITIINDILDFSKIEAGRLDLEAQPLDLRLCVESALDVLAHRAAEKRIDLAVQIDANTPDAIIGDAVRLRQVLVNLLANAVKFTEQGEVVVTLAAGDWRPTTDDRGRIMAAESVVGGRRSVVHFAVRDTGIGIPPERIDRLFQSFSQVDPSTTRQYGGTGLGLVISRRLAELMGGRMWVESVPGHGSTFHFTVQAEVAPSTPPVYLSGEQPQLRGKHVLVVDDHPTNRTIVCHQVASWGMTCAMAASGAEALALLQDGRAFDLAILDMDMPDMDGLALAGEIRRWEAEQLEIGGRQPPISDLQSQLPLVLLTSLVQRASDLNGSAFAAVLTKPVKASQLYNTLVEVFMEQAQSARATRPPSDAPSSFDAQMGTRMPLRILLVEDNLINQKVALLALGKLGYQADVAANGIAALEAVGRQTYDVVLMDVHMPVLDGLNATRRIRADARVYGGHQPWIIAMTANAMQGDRELCLAAGMDDYIAKPVHIHELRAALEHARPHNHAQEGKQGSTSPALSLHAAIDATALNELRDSGALDELIELFLIEAPAGLTALRVAIAQDDLGELRELAHSLKGSSRYLGARPLAGLLAELEQIGSLVEAAAILIRVEEEFGRVRQALGEYQRG
jgi:PAS domain S-box-containing protein